MEEACKKDYQAFIKAIGIKLSEVAKALHERPQEFDRVLEATWSAAWAAGGQYQKSVEFLRKGFN